MKSDHVTESHQTEYWTDEKHVRFLNSMETSFVRTMFENNHRNLLRLDRFLPDTSDSTLDLKPRPTKKKFRISKEFLGVRENRRIGKRSRRIMPAQPLSSKEDDQVVPQLENRAVGDDQLDDESSHDIISNSCTSSGCC